MAKGKRVAVTGAAGFIGRAVVERIERGALATIGDLRLNDVQPFHQAGAKIVIGSYAEPAVREQLIGNGVDLLFHLASLPGGASEGDPALGRSVNLDGTIALIDVAAGASENPVIVYTSSIAALGRHDQTVTADAALRPAGSYGTHKAMLEYYLADLTRRGVVDARSVRPAGVVARPRTAFAGFATAWMSDLFYAALEQREIAIPARAGAHIWLQSVDAVADNIIHAALMSVEGWSPGRAWTLPATVVRLDQLVDALGRRTGHALRVDFRGGPTDHPPLDASAALAVGFISDGDTDALVDAVLARIKRG